MNKIELHFSGPYSLLEGDSLVFHCKYAGAPGVYLWVVETNNGNYIHYIGETRQFAKRQAEHLTNVLGLNYGIFSVEKAKQGICEPIWGGMWRDRGYNKITELLEFYRDNSAQVVEYLRLVKVFFAEFGGDDEMRKHIEGWIAKHLREKEPKNASLYPADNNTGIRRGMPSAKLIVTSDEAIWGLLKEVDI